MIINFRIRKINRDMRQSLKKKTMDILIKNLIFIHRIYIKQY